MSDALVTAIVGNGIASEEAAHELREALRPAAEEQVGMVRQKHPSIESGSCGRRDVSQPCDERLPILPIRHDLPSLHAAEHDVVQGPGSIKACLARHGEVPSYDDGM
jgi:hypothetical protein